MSYMLSTNCLDLLKNAPVDKIDVVSESILFASGEARSYSHLNILNNKKQIVNTKLAQNLATYVCKPKNDSYFYVKVRDKNDDYSDLHEFIRQFPNAAFYFEGEKKYSAVFCCDSGFKGKMNSNVLESCLILRC